MANELYVLFLYQITILETKVKEKEAEMAAALEKKSIESDRQFQILSDEFTREKSRMVQDYSSRISQVSAIIFFSSAQIKSK